MAIDFNGTAIPGAIVTGTSTSSGVGNGDLAAQVVKATFDKYIGMRLRTEPMLRRFATVAPREVAHPGSSVDLYIDNGDLALATTPLSEYADPAAEALPAPVKVTGAPKEYGKTTVTSLRLRKFSWSNIDLKQAELVGINLRDTVDELVRVKAYGTTGGVSNGGFTKYHVPTSNVGVATGTGALADVGLINSAASRRIVANFVANSVQPFADNNFVCIIHPDQSVDLREETDAAGWRNAHLLLDEDPSSPAALWNGELGTYERVKYIESPRVTTAVDGTTGHTIYPALFLGNEALAEILVQEFGTVATPSNDAFGRLMGLGWYGFADWIIYREQAGAVLYTESTAV